MNTSTCFCTCISIFVYSIHERLSNACDTGGMCARLVDSVAYVSCVVVSDSELQCVAVVLQWCCSGVAVVLQWCCRATLKAFARILSTPPCTCPVS